jgi:hypothetical protein
MSRGRAQLLVVLVLLGAPACGSEDDDVRGGDGDADADSDADGDADGDADADADADGDGDCEPPEPEGCELVTDPCLPGLLEVGSGAFGFQEIVAGAEEVELVHGPQGGYHVFGSVKVRDVALDPGVSLLFFFRPFDRCDDIMLAEARSAIDVAEASFRNAGDGFRAAYGYLVILDTSAPEEIDGRRFVLGVELTDAEGSVYRDETEVVVSWPGE